MINEMGDFESHYIRKPSVELGLDTNEVTTRPNDIRELSDVRGVNR
jgi:hypothetical protein